MSDADRIALLAVVSRKQEGGGTRGTPTNPFRSLLGDRGCGTPWKLGRGHRYPELTAAQQALAEGFYKTACQIGSKRFLPFARCGEADVIGAALEGLVLAAQRYRPGKVHFSFVARLYIHKAINEFYRKHGQIIRLPWREIEHKHPVTDIGPLAESLAADDSKPLLQLPEDWRTASPKARALLTLCETDQEREILWRVVVLEEAPTQVGQDNGVPRQHVTAVLRRVISRLRKVLGTDRDATADVLETHFPSE